jgi:indole-3-glycerol phosphate synthase
MHNKLQTIIAQTKKDLQLRKTKSPVVPLLRASKGIAVIAEIKLASPTEKQLGSVNDVTPLARDYQKGGAAMISIVTEKHFFKGDPSFIHRIKKAGVTIPVLQKDFVIDALQIVESKQAGADAILLIAKMLRRKQLKQFVSLAKSLGVEPVVEVNDAEDLDNAIAAEPSIIAVNARDLESFTVDVDRACALMKKIPDGFIKLGFSGIHGKEEVRKYQQAGADGVLVGTSLMKAEDKSAFLKELKQ